VRQAVQDALSAGNPYILYLARISHELFGEKCGLEHTIDYCG